MNTRALDTLRQIVHILEKNMSRREKKKKKDIKTEKEKGVVGTQDEQNRSDGEESYNEQANFIFLPIENQVLYTPNVLSCDGFEDDPLEFLV